MIKRLIDKIKEILEMIMGDCGNCLHENMCPFKESGSSCWEQNKGSYYIRKKVHKNK